MVESEEKRLESFAYEHLAHQILWELQELVKFEKLKDGSENASFVNSLSLHLGIKLPMNLVFSSLMVSAIRLHI